MYNEESHELQSTLAAISQCVAYMAQTSTARASRLGEEHTKWKTWEQTAVAIVSDGRSKVNKGTKEWLQEHGLFDENVMQIGEQVSCLLLSSIV